MYLLNCIAAELVVVCIISIGFGGRIPWYRRYHGLVQQILLFIAGGIMAYANAEYEDKTILFIGVAMMIISFVLCIVWGKRIGSSKRLRCIPLKVGQYRIEMTEKFVPAGGANMLVGHRIITQNEVIQCIGNTPEENAEVDVYVIEDNQGNLQCQYFEYKKRDWNASRVVFGVTGLLVCVCGLLLPIITMKEVQANGLSAERTSLFGNMVILIFGGCGVMFFKNVKQDMLYKILYYFNWCVYVFGILGVLLSL